MENNIGFLSRTKLSAIFVEEMKFQLSSLSFQIALGKCFERRASFLVAWAAPQVFY